MSAVVIVGVGPGIGAAVARRFAREQTAVGLISRSQSTLERVAATLPMHTQTAMAPADVTDEVALRYALDRVRRELGPIDTLVYNAGLIRSDLPGQLSTREHQEAWAINVVGAVTAAAHVGAVAPGTVFDPDEIAEHYWRLRVQSRDNWEHEVLVVDREAAR
jgi:short-subunit dehydrogenase